MARDLKEFIIKNYQKAIDYHYIQPYYQPVIRTISRQLCSFEALARWIDPVIGMIYPDEFIPVAERNGSIIQIGAFVLETVCWFIKENRIWAGNKSFGGGMDMIMPKEI